MRSISVNYKNISGVNIWKMSPSFAFLRAINAGPGRVVRMNVLRQAFESLGFSGVATFLGSGNVVFETRATDVGTLEKKIERRLEGAQAITCRCS